MVQQLAVQPVRTAEQALDRMVTALRRSAEYGDQGRELMADTQARIAQFYSQIATALLLRDLSRQNADGLREIADHITHSLPDESEHDMHAAPPPNAEYEGFSVPRPKAM